MQKGANKKESKPAIHIVGYNLLAMVFYTAMCAFFHEFGAFLDTFFLLIHVSACFILGVTTGGRIWGLSGLVVLLIGFSTCVGILWKLV